MLSLLLRLRLEWVFSGLMLAGFLLIAASWLIGVDDVLFDPATIGTGDVPTRQVGYTYAINWGLTYFLLFPVIGALLVAALQDVPRVLIELDELRVLRSPNGTRTSSAIVTSWVAGSTTRRVFLALVAVAVPAIYSAGEWVFNNLLRLLKVRKAPDFWDWDWGLKCVMPEHEAACGALGVFANIVFDFACFVAQAFYLGLFLAFVIYVLDFRHALLGERTSVRLFPALRLNDRRRGFGQFEPLLTKVLMVVAVAFVAAYAVRLQNLYLRSHASSLWWFLREDVVHGAFAGSNGSASGVLASLPANLFDAGDPAGRQTVMVGIGLIFLFAGATSVVLGTVFTAARHAKTNALTYYASASAEPFFGLSLSEEQARADSMTVWPIGYMQLNRLLLWTALACASLVWFRIGLYFCGFTVAGLVVFGKRSIERMLQVADTASAHSAQTTSSSVKAKNPHGGDHEH